MFRLSSYRDEVSGVIRLRVSGVRCQVSGVRREKVSGVSLSANGGNEKFELPPALTIYD